MHRCHRALPGMTAPSFGMLTSNACSATEADLALLLLRPQHRCLECSACSTMMSHLALLLLGPQRIPHRCRGLAHAAGGPERSSCRLCQAWRLV